MNLSTLSDSVSDLFLFLVKKMVHIVVFVCSSILGNEERSDKPFSNFCQISGLLVLPLHADGPRYSQAVRIPVQGYDALQIFYLRQRFFLFSSKGLFLPMFCHHTSTCLRNFTVRGTP